MLRNKIIKLIVVGLLMVSGLACTMAEPQPYTGDADAHQRHDTGIDSQVSDH